MATPSGSISQNFENTSIALQEIETSVENLNLIVTNISTQMDNAGFQGDAKLALDDAAVELQAALRREIASLQDYGQRAKAEVEAQAEAERNRAAMVDGMGSPIQSPTY
ncbi:hypothetical protein ACFUJR_34580 [Streptomyces sp. NPDC057271]|uniref:hypothetical protein n=1 Tax=unclassified Streptomyces TaxID=2593676 RepID=UPI003631B3F0